MKSKIVLITLMLVITLTGCNDFLNAPPVKRNNVKIETTEDLNQLLASPSLIGIDGRALILITDSYGLYTDYYDQNPDNYVLQNSYLNEILWLPKKVAAQGSDVWGGQYSDIAIANAVMANIDNVSGTEADKKRLMEDAYLVRAYAYFELATLYCLPYSEANRSELGLSLKQTLNYDESVARASLGKTMDFIEKELKLALQTSETRSEDKPWRISKVAAQGFAARFYLYLHNYDQALNYANKALANYNTLVDYETYFTPLLDTTETSGGSYISTVRNVDYMFDEFLYTRLKAEDTFQAVPSQKLLKLYEENDFRYIAFITEDFSLFWTGQPGFAAYQQFGFGSFLYGPTTAEMYLIRAEVRARKGDMAGAVSDLNKLRSYRYKSGTYTNLTVGDFAGKADLVQFIIDERQREFPFTLRWYDIKRINSDPAGIVNPITITRKFYVYDGISVNTSQTKTYKLEPGDARFAWPIPSSEIQLSQGVIVQNPYN